MNPADIHREGPTEDIEEDCMPEPCVICEVLREHERYEPHWFHRKVVSTHTEPSPNSP